MIRKNFSCFLVGNSIRVMQYCTYCQHPVRQKMSSTYVKPLFCNTAVKLIQNDSEEKYCLR
jgi:hypothetical protein